MKRERPSLRKSVAAVILVGAILGLLTTALVRADTVLSGTTDAGAHYQIVVPDSWNGDLVIFNRGYGGYSNPPDLGFLSGLQLSEGYAVAATSFQHVRWALFKSKVDLQHLVGIFKENFGQPNQIFLYGGSMGGLVSAAAVEETNLGNVVGALCLCAPLHGLRTFDYMLDLRMVYDTVCSGVPGAEIPGGAEGLPEDGSFTDSDVVLAVNVCTGVFFPAHLRTPEQQLRMDQILSELQIPDSQLPGFGPALLFDMFFATTGLSDLAHSEGKLNGKLGLTNLGVIYDDPWIDANIERVPANPGARNRASKHYTATGNVRDAKIISMATDKDPLVVVEHQSFYSSVVPQSNLTTAIVVEDLPSHCFFSAGESIAAWEALRSWVATGLQPTAADIQQACQLLGAGQCRIDPSFLVGDLDDRIPPR